MQPRPDPASLTDLRRHLAEMALRGAPTAVGRVSFGAPALDAALNGGIARAALHEVYAPATADLAAATGFAVGLARIIPPLLALALGVRELGVGGASGGAGGGVEHLEASPSEICRRVALGGRVRVQVEQGEDEEHPEDADDDAPRGELGEPLPDARLLREEVLVLLERVERG